VLRQPGGSAISGTYHGKGEGGEYLRRLGEKPMTVKVTRLLADGDTVVAVTDVTVGNETCENVEVFTIRDGKTVAVQVHTDTAMMERVYGKKQVAAG
jgi:ketosteroid isomerase-like protein